MSRCATLLNLTSGVPDNQDSVFAELSKGNMTRSSRELVALVADTFHNIVDGKRQAGIIVTANQARDAVAKTRNAAQQQAVADAFAGEDCAA